MTEASSIPDTPLSLWLELFEKIGDEPFYATNIHGDLECFFCGKPSPSLIEQQHEPDCIWVRARAVTGWDENRAH